MTKGYYRPGLSFTQVKALLKPEPAGELAAVRLHYAERESKTGVGVGAHGIRQPDTVDLYRRALQWAYSRLTSPPIGLNPPSKPIPIYVFEIGEWRGIADPVTFRDGTTLAIALPSRTALPALALERQYMVAAAVHEMCHVICHSQPGMYLIIEEPKWIWISEGTSVWLESLLMSEGEAKRAELPVSFDWMSYALNWCDYPETPVDAEPGWYQAFLFVRYLAAKHGGEAIIGELWRQARVDVDPWQIIEELTGRTRDQLFTDHCHQAYLLNDPQSACYSPEVFQRFGSRAITESWDVGPGEERSCDGAVWGMGCRYYRIYPRGVSSVTVACGGKEWGAAVTLTAGLAMTELRGAGSAVPLEHPGEAEIGDVTGADHVWLAVCGKAGAHAARYSFRVRGK